ncbi:hypothetical protein L1987_47164 [Smallanthus sonchifolius]|uniref:Uncharacterized protein n=1 Tax=Smallanthus sonchifolius TaxID=185202 RepID=A0ACB9G1T8_9ASTR|nr:hypothetical protein L1987_47164 [Smallanthus sonchifolius]
MYHLSGDSPTAGMNAGVSVCPEVLGVLWVKEGVVEACEVFMFWISSCILWLKGPKFALSIWVCDWFGGNGCEMGCVVASVKTGEFGSDVGLISRYPKPDVVTLIMGTGCGDGGTELIRMLVLVDTNGANEDTLAECDILVTTVNGVGLVFFGRTTCVHENCLPASNIPGMAAWSPLPYAPEPLFLGEWQFRHSTKTACPFLSIHLPKKPNHLRLNATRKNRCRHFHTAVHTDLRLYCFSHMAAPTSDGHREDDRISRITSAIRVIADFPKPGILFQDITTLLLDPMAFKDTIDLFVERYKDKDISVVAGVEARGFIFGPPIALAIGAKFVPMRKPNKLPGAVISQEYSLEYGTDKIEMHIGAVQEGERALVIDDLIATGGTLCAAISLLERVGVNVVECACVIELPDLKGRERLGDKPLFVLVS